MADLKITGLGAGSTVASTDQFVMVDVSDTSMAASGTDVKLGAGALAVGVAPFETHTASQVSDFNEVAQDAVGGIVQSSTTVAAVYNDAGATIIHHVPSAALVAQTHISDFTEASQDVIGSTLISTSTIVFVYNDAGNQETASLGISPYDLPQNSKTITTTTYTFVAGDNGYWVEFTGSNAVAVSFPPNSSASLRVVAWSQSNIGQITFAGAGAAKVYNPTGLKSRTTSAVGGAFQLSTDRWLLWGDVSA